jgi:hypothetical protein
VSVSADPGDPADLGGVDSLPDAVVNAYATTRSDLTSLTASTAVCYREGPPNMTTDTSTLPRRALIERDDSATPTRRESPSGTDRRPAAQPPRRSPAADICSVCCYLTRAGSRLLIPCSCSVPMADRSGRPAPASSRPGFHTIPRPLASLRRRWTPPASSTCSSQLADPDQFRWHGLGQWVGSSVGKPPGLSVGKTLRDGELG